MKENNLKLKINIGSASFFADGNPDIVCKQKDEFLSFVDGVLGKMQNIDGAQGHTFGNVAEKSAISKDTPAHMINSVTWNYLAQFDSLNSLIREKHLTKDTDIVAATAYYLTSQGARCFLSRGIKDEIQRAHIKAPKNISQSITNNIKRSFIIETRPSPSEKKGKLKTYKITNKLIEWISAA